VDISATSRMSDAEQTVIPIFHQVGAGDRHNGSDKLTVAERPFHRSLVWGVTLSRTLWGSLAFRHHAGQVRGSLNPVEAAIEISVEYARGQRRRRLICHLLLHAALAPEKYVEGVLDRIWVRPIIDRDGRPLKGYPGATPKQAADAKRGSELIARRGAGLCLSRDCTNQRTKKLVGFAMPSGPYETSNTLYCDKHGNDASRYGRAARDADTRTLERTFDHVLEAWPSSAEQSLLWWWDLRRRVDREAA